MKTKFKIAALAVSAAMASLSGSASAQISGDTVKIGFITDLSGLYSDIDGPGGVEAIKMAIADFGGTVLGKKIELVTADHQNKADIAASKAREWFDISSMTCCTNQIIVLAMHCVCMQVSAYCARDSA